MAEENFNDEELVGEIHRQYAQAHAAMRESGGVEAIIKRARKSADGLYESFRELSLAHKDDGNEVAPVFALMIAKTLVAHIVQKLLTQPGNGIGDAVAQAYLDLTLPMTQMMYDRVQQELLEQDIADIEQGD